jgi:hypothetical protein
MIRNSYLLRTPKRWSKLALAVARVQANYCYIAPGRVTDWDKVNSYATTVAGPQIRVW